MGAVLVRDGQIVARAHDLRERLHDPTAHAELLALRQAAREHGDWRLREATLYVTLEPCPMCAGAMLMSQLGRCVYGAVDARQGCCGSVYDLPADPRLHGQTRWTMGVESEACGALLSDFFRQLR